MVSEAGLSEDSLKPLVDRMKGTIPVFIAKAEVSAHEGAFTAAQLLAVEGRAALNGQLILAKDLLESVVLVLGKGEKPTWTAVAVDMGVTVPRSSNRGPKIYMRNFWTRWFGRDPFVDVDDGVDVGVDVDADADADEAGGGAAAAAARVRSKRARGGGAAAAAARVGSKRACRDDAETQELRAQLAAAQAEVSQKQADVQTLENEKAAQVRELAQVRATHFLEMQSLRNSLPVNYFTRMVAAAVADVKRHPHAEWASRSRRLKASFHPDRNPFPGDAPCCAMVRARVAYQKGADARPCDSIPASRSTSTAV